VKILAVVPLYPPTSRVGAWLATHRCLAYLAARGHDVDVVPYLHGMIRWDYDLDGVHVRPGAVLSDWPRPDLVVSHLGDDHRGAELAASWGVPSVRMVHGLHPDNLANLQANKPALTVFNSASLAALTGWSGPSIVVHPSTDTGTAEPGGRVTLVNLAESKGGRLFWQLAKSMPDVAFLGVRGGYGEQVCNKAKNVTVIDPTEDMAGDVYAKTRILLMPSERETWGMVGVEAMRCGIPVIAHPTEGLGESLGRAGIFVDRDDPEGWEREIRRLLIKSEWRRASTAAMGRAVELASTDHLPLFADRIEALVPVAA
jgi:hypothetical protein